MDEGVPEGFKLNWVKFNMKPFANIRGEGTRATATGCVFNLSWERGKSFYARIALGVHHSLYSFQSSLLHPKNIHPTKLQLAGSAHCNRRRKKPLE
jgi:hypothetical protein